MRMIVVAAGLVLAVSGLSACSDGDGDKDAKSPATYHLPMRTVRPDEKAVQLPPGADGDTSFTVIGLTTGLPELAGSHADMKAKVGQFVRIRLVLVNNGRTTALIDVMKQQLLTADGKAYKPDLDAMTIKRQPFKFDAGASVRTEFDLWYDIPATAKLASLRLYGGSTLTDLKDLQGTDLRLS